MTERSDGTEMPQTTTVSDAVANPMGQGHVLPTVSHKHLLPDKKVDSQKVQGEGRYHRHITGAWERPEKAVPG